MTTAGFDTDAWIERVAQVLPPLERAQVPFLRECQERNGCVIDLRDDRPPRFPQGDLRPLYGEVRNGRLWGREARHAPLRALLDPMRYALPGHPTL